MDIINVLNTRYSAKVFDKTKKISDEDMKKVETLLQMSPSSTNIQPWHFIIASSDEGKKRVAKASQGFYSFNEPKVLDCSAVVIFACRVDALDAYLEHLTTKEDADGRFPQETFKEQNHMGRKIFSDMHKYDYKDQQHWLDKQVYLNLGNFLLGTAALGIHSLAMEGLDMKLLDEEFGLRQKGFTSSVVVAIGYSATDDFNATLPKSRLSKDEIITRA